MAGDSMMDTIVPTDAFWLAAAEAQVRAYCGWHVAPVLSDELVLDGGGGVHLLLPSRLVLEVTAVTNDGDDVLDAVRVSRHGVLELESGWTSRVGSVSVSLRHGFEPGEVSDVLGVIVAVAARSSMSAGPVVQQSVAGSMVRYGTNGGAPIGSPLLAAEKELLSRYVLNWGA